MSAHEIVGTKGSLRLDPAYEWAAELQHQLTIDGQKKTKVFKKRDQFAPELTYFSDCILENKDPQPSGEEGLADVRIIRALYGSAETGTPVRIENQPQRKRPSPSQQITRPAVEKAKLVRASGPSPR